MNTKTFEHVSTLNDQNRLILEEINDAKLQSELNDFIDDSAKTVPRVLKLNQIPTSNKSNVQLRKSSKAQNHHHEGPVRIKFMENEIERNKTLSARRPTLFKKVF